MKASLENRAEIVKLARLLGRPPEQLSFLGKVAAADVRRLREQATDVLFDADRDVLGRVIAGSRLLPTSIAASIGERAFGPLLCARIAGLLDRDRANELAEHLDPGFLADVAVEIDPRRASEVIGGIAVEETQAAAAELTRRGEYVAMGRFVAHLSDEAIRACLEVMDDASVLRTAFVLEDKDRLDHVASLMPEGRLPGIIRAAGEHGLWTEALDLVGHLGERRRGEVAEIAAEAGDELLEGMVRAAHELGLWEVLLPVNRVMSEESRTRFAALAPFHEEDVLAAIVRTAAEQELWRELLPLVAELPAHAQRHVALTAGELEPAMLERAVAAAGEHGLWPMLVGIASDMDETAQRKIAELIAGADDAVIDSLLAALPSVADAARQDGRLETGLRLIESLDADEQSRIVEAARRLTPEQRARVAEQARSLGVLDRLGPLGDVLRAS